MVSYSIPGGGSGGGTGGGDVYYGRNTSAAAQAEQAHKVSITNVTNRTNGAGVSPDSVSLPRIGTGEIVPFVLGRDIIRNPPIMWYGNLKPISESKTTQNTTTDSTTGDETITTTIETTVVGYSIDIQFSLGLGPGTRLRSIFLDNVVIWTGTEGPARSTFAVAGNPSIKDVIVAGGNFDQAIDPYLDGLITEDLSAYRGFAYIIILGISTDKLGNLAFEVDRYPDPLALGAHNKVGEDINPATAMAEIITSTWGGAGKDPSVIGTTFATVAEVLYNENNGCSLINSEQTSANNLNAIILSQINGIMYEDHETGKIELVLVRDNFDRADLVRVFDRDTISIDQMDKGSWSGIPTSLKVTYTDRSFNYREIPLIARNLATSDKLSKSLLTLSFPAVRNGDLANRIMAREGATSSSPTQAITMTTNRKTARCNPGDIILLTCEKYRYYSVPAIVLKRRTQPVDDNRVTLTCQVILYPNNKTLFAVPEPSFFVPLDPNPHTPNSVKLISAPYYMRFGYRSLLPLQEITKDSPLVLGDAYNASQVDMPGYYLFSGEYVPFYTGVFTGVGAETDINFRYPLFGKLTGSIDKYYAWDGTTVDITIHDLGQALTDYDAILSSFGIALNHTCFVFIGDEVFVLDRGRNGASTVAIDLTTRTLSLGGCYRAYLDTVAQDHVANSDAFVLTNVFQSEYLSKISFDFASVPDFKFVGGAKPKGVYTKSPVSAGLVYSGWTANDRANRPLRPHNTEIDGFRDDTPHALVLGAPATITWNIRARTWDFVTSIRLPKFQLDPSEGGEVVSGSHIVYRVFIVDSALVEWDCGATVDTADHDSLVITVPALAAVGVGELYVQAELDQISGTQVSLYQDRLPITLA